MRKTNRYYLDGVNPLEAKPIAMKEKPILINFSEKKEPQLEDFDDGF